MYQVPTRRRSRTIETVSIAVGLSKKETPMLTAAEILDECTPYYDRDHDTERLNGDSWDPTSDDMQEIADGDYDLLCYYPVNREDQFPDRASAISALSAVYAGPDIHGIGWQLPKA